MPSLTNGIENFVASIFGIFANLASSIFAVFHSAIALVQDVISSAISLVIHLVSAAVELVSGTIGFVAGNILAIAVVILGIFAYQRYAGRTPNARAKKTA